MAVQRQKNEALLRWEENKQMQKKMEKYKELLSAKTKESEEQHKIITRLRDRITRFVL